MSRRKIYVSDYAHQKTLKFYEQCKIHNKNLFFVKRLIHCPKNKADFQEKKGGSPLEGKFSSNPWK
jgi:hypothetical protein